jgi:hypothetical protein
MYAIHTPRSVFEKSPVTRCSYRWKKATLAEFSALMDRSMR